MNFKGHYLRAFNSLYPRIIKCIPRDDVSTTAYVADVFLGISRARRTSSR